MNRHTHKYEYEETENKTVNTIQSDFDYIS